MPLEEFIENGGTESLLETPILENLERTTYKKGPGRPYNNNPRKVRPQTYPNIDYESPFDTDPYRSGDSYERLGSGPRERGRYRPNYSTTVRPQTYDRLRSRYPNTRENTNIRTKKKQSFDTASDSNNRVKPLGMRDKRSIHSNSQNRERLKRNQKEVHVRSKDNLDTNARSKRHVGPHDEEGLQRLLSTGSLMPSSLPVTHPLYNHSVDFVFAVYWFFPAKTRAILPEDQKCIEEKMASETIRFDPSSKRSFIINE